MFKIDHSRTSVWGVIHFAMKRTLIPKQVLAIQCPTCGAAPGEKCELAAGGTIRATLDEYTASARAAKFTLTGGLYQSQLLGTTAHGTSLGLGRDFAGRFQVNAYLYHSRFDGTPSITTFKLPKYICQRACVGRGRPARLGRCSAYR